MNVHQTQRYQRSEHLHLRAEGLEERVGYFGRRVSVDDILESFFAPLEDGREPSRP